MHTKKAHEIRHAKRDEQVATPPNKNPTWKRIMTPPMRSPMLRRIRESPLANVKGHFDHLRHFERMANRQAMKKHTKFVPLLPPGTASSTGSRPMSTHSFDSVSSAADFHLSQKKTVCTDSRRTTIRAQSRSSKNAGRKESEVD